MKTKYQLIFLGQQNPLRADIEGAFFNHINELGLAAEAIEIIDESNFDEQYIANAPTYCLYFGIKNSAFRHIPQIERLQTDATLILPIVEAIPDFNASIPEQLRPINGFQLASKHDIEALVNHSLEGLGLLRLSRRLFISYRRDESSTVAIQLFERFEKAGFDVFLDTHSVPKGENFQEELWHRLADTDIVILLNTPGFLQSHWTTQELAQANSMSIGILQLVWPNYKPERSAELSIPFYLSETNFGNKQFADAKSYLTDDIMEEIVNRAESLRARSLAARQDNIITEFMKSANNAGAKVNLQSEKFITMTNSKSEEIVIIPTVGVPQAFIYNQSEELVKRIRQNSISAIHLLYDHRNIRTKWLDHLAWLDNYLPIKTIKLTERESWLGKN